MEEVNVNGGAIDDAPKAPQPVQLDPQTVAHLTQTITNNVAGMFQPPPQQQQGVLDAWAANQIARGADPAQIQEMITLVKANEMDQRTKAEQAYYEQAQQDFHRGFWARIEDAWEQVVEKFPALARAKGGLFDEIHGLLQSDPAFQDVRNQMARREQINRAQAARFVSKVSDEYLKQLGVTRTEQPVSTRSSAPSQTGRTTDGAKQHFLDPGQEKLYRTFRGDLGEDRARELARGYTLD